MPRKAVNVNSLSRGRIRASMNKYNLFNLYKKKDFASNNPTTTLYQQKWNAKQETRSYHGEHLTESRWKTLFDANLETVAQLDASLKGKRIAETPMPLQTYAPLEKRLEVALFRAMFASSVRQARQFILGGHVTVNGVVIKHPSFPLQAGDVFHVTPEKVLLAMGRVKPSLDKAIKVDSDQIAVWNKYVKQAKENPKTVWDLKQLKPKSLNTIDDYTKDLKEKSSKFSQDTDSKMKKLQNETTRESILSSILKIGNGNENVTLDQFKKFGKNSSKALLIYEKLQKFNHDLMKNHSIDQAKSFIKKKKPEFTSTEEARLATAVKQLLGEIQRDTWENIRVSAQEDKVSKYSTTKSYSPSYANSLSYHQLLDKDAIKENESKAKINLPWQKGLFGRKDPSKPYFTPWTPRPFIGCFAILPAHIEISFTTCHAIYLRDPIARPGHSEVITPLPIGQHERAYLYYTRKGL